MKSMIRRAARRLSKLPLLGRLVHIMAALWRLPLLRAQASSMQQRVSRLDELERQASHGMQQQASGLDGVKQHIVELEATQLRLEHLYREQLPSLLDAVAKLNARQHEVDQDQENLVFSVPVALRQLRRDLSSLEREHEANSEQLRVRMEGVDTLLGSQGATLEVLAGQVGTVSGQLDPLRVHMAGVDRLLGSQGATLEMLSAQWREVGDQLAKHDGGYGELRANTAYLFGRVEFVRRELLFEMRYGHSSPDKQQDPLEVTARVVAAEKLVQARQSGLRLNLGCGHIPLDGFINVDRRELPGVDVVAEVNALPDELGEADEIFSAHLLEHFPQEQLRRELLPHWKSLLKKGGVLRAVVPDAEAMIREYTAGKYPYNDMREVFYGGQDYDGDFHFNMFTPEHMSNLLEEAGFVDVQVIDAGRRNGKCFEFEVQGKYV